MSKPFIANPELIDVLIQSNRDEFKISTIRDHFLTTTMKHKSKDTVRLFVSRQLNTMVQQGLLTSSGTLHRKVFRKTELFSQYYPVTNKSDNSDLTHESSLAPLPKKKPYLEELERLRNRLEAELTMSIAEVDEYHSIMKQFPQTQAKVKGLHKASTQHSATLTGQITAVTKTIELFQLELV